MHMASDLLDSLTCLQSLFTCLKNVFCTYILKYGGRFLHQPQSNTFFYTYKLD